MGKPATQEPRKKQGDKLEALIDEAVGTDSEEEQEQPAGAEEGADEQE